MALNIRDPATVRLAAEVAELAGETKTRAVRTALEERAERLRIVGLGQDRRQRVLAVLEQMWAEIPPGPPQRGQHRPVSKDEREEILGYGPDGV